MVDVFEKIIENRKNGKSYVLATVVEVNGSTPRHEGAKMLILQDEMYGTVGGGRVEYEVIEEAKKMIASSSKKHTILKKYTFTGSEKDNLPMICGGEMTVFMELYSNINLHIFGGGHVGLAVSKLSDLMGYNIFIYDNRPEVLNDSFPASCNLTLLDSYENMKLDNDFGLNDCIIITTHMHLNDATVLEQLYNKGAAYVGMIGSRKKVGIVMTNLKDKGCSEDALNKVHSPIGLKIASETPAEIAVSIIGEIIKVMKDENK